MSSTKSTVLSADECDVVPEASVTATFVATDATATPDAATVVIPELPPLLPPPPPPPVTTLTNADQKELRGATDDVTTSSPPVEVTESDSSSLPSMEIETSFDSSARNADIVGSQNNIDSFTIVDTDVECGKCCWPWRATLNCGLSHQLPEYDGNGDVKFVARLRYHTSHKKRNKRLRRSRWSRAKWTRKKDPEAPQ